MTFEITTITGENITLINPFEMKITKSLNTPAHSLVAQFVILKPLDEICFLKVTENEKVIFKGNVDEQRVVYNGTNTKLFISARENSKLIDNEACPVTYTRPSMIDIYNYHLNPFGVKGVLGNGICQGDFAVQKGTCHWAVVKEFCRCALNVFPVITEDGYLDVENSFLKEEPIVFSNDNKSNQGFSQIEVKHKRYGVAGKINYKSGKATDYKNTFYNEEAKKRKITTQRYLNLLNTKSFKRQYLLHRATLKYLKGSFEIDITTLPQNNLKLGRRAKIKDQKLGSFEGLCIYEIVYKLKNGVKNCIATLVPIEHVI